MQQGHGANVPRETVSACSSACSAANARQPRDHRGALRTNRGGGAADRVLFRLECAGHAARPLRDAVAAHVPVPAPPARRGGAARDVAQMLIDEFFIDVEHSLRELGIGDLGVPKRMKKLARMFYGRTAVLCRCAGARRPRRARCGACPQCPARRRGVAAGGAAGRLCRWQPVACWPARHRDDIRAGTIGVSGRRKQRWKELSMRQADGHGEPGIVRGQCRPAAAQGHAGDDRGRRSAARKAGRDPWLLSVEAWRAELLVAPWKRNGVKVIGPGRGGHHAGNASSRSSRSRRDISEPVEALFLPEDSKLGRHGFEDGGEILLDAEGPDSPETFSGDTIDVGALAEEFFGLAIDPYPRKPGASLEVAKRRRRCSRERTSAKAASCCGKS